MIRVVLDTNVLISGLLFGGNPQRVLETVLSGIVNMALSREMLHELEYVLCGRKFRYPPDTARSIVRELESISEFIVPTRKIPVVKTDPYDNMILECAAEAKAEYIVSGDAHLLRLEAFEGIAILNPAQFLDLIGTR